MQLAKDRLDVGLFTDDRDMLAFMEHDVGLGPPERLPVTRGVDQFRFDVDGSVVKVNCSETLDTKQRSGIRGIQIARAGTVDAETRVGPDGVRVTLAAPGDRSVDQLGIEIAVPDLAKALHYYDHVLGWTVEGATVRLGDSVVLLEEADDTPREISMPVRGWTYLTVQIHDCDAETAGAVERGAQLLRPAITLGEVARFSMIGDPWGNALELSQRASLTGPLPKNAP